MTAELQGLHVVVTRPRLQASELTTALKAAGARTLEFPTIEVVGLDPPEPPRAGTFDAVIFTSVNAVRQGALQGLCRRLGDGEAESLVVAVGAATQAALAQYGVVAVMPSQANSEGILAMPELTGLAPGAGVQVVRGIGGREVLPAGLRARGLRVVVTEVYQRRRPSVPEQRVAELVEARFVDHVALATSVETFDNLRAILGLERTKLMAQNGFLAPVSERIAAHILAELGAWLRYPLWQLRGAGVSDVVTGLRDYWRQHAETADMGRARTEDE